MGPPEGDMGPGPDDDQWDHHPGDMAGPGPGPDGPMGPPPEGDMAMGPEVKIHYLDQEPLLHQMAECHLMTQ